MLPRRNPPGPLYGERAIAGQLICFDNPRPARPYEVSIELPEFTCLCRFPAIRLCGAASALSAARVVELKAIKLYVNVTRQDHLA